MVSEIMGRRYVRIVSLDQWSPANTQQHTAADIYALALLPACTSHTTARARILMLRRRSSSAKAAPSVCRREDTSPEKLRRRSSWLAKASYDYFTLDIIRRSPPGCGMSVSEDYTCLTCIQLACLLMIGFRSWGKAGLANFSFSCILIHEYWSKIYKEQNKRILKYKFEY